MSVHCGQHGERRVALLSSRLRPSSSRDGHESDWSESRLDTPRADARNAFVYAESHAEATVPVFVFLDDGTKKLGVVGSSTAAPILDSFSNRASPDGSLWFVPARTGVTMSLYSTQPVGDLTSIDRAPASRAWAVSRSRQVPGFAYVFRTVKSDGVHFAGIRVAFRTADYVVFFDWSYQTAPGNAGVRPAILVRNRSSRKAVSEKRDQAVP